MLRALAGLPQPWPGNSSCAFLGAHPAPAVLQLKFSHWKMGALTHPLLRASYSLPNTVKHCLPNTAVLELLKTGNAACY